MKKAMCVWHMTMCSHQVRGAFTPLPLMQQQWDSFSTDLKVGAKSTFSVTAAAASCSTASAVRRQPINVNHMTQLSGSCCISYVSCFGHGGGAFCAYNDNNNNPRPSGTHTTPRSNLSIQKTQRTQQQSVKQLSLAAFRPVPAKRFFLGSSSTKDTASDRW